MARFRPAAVLLALLALFLTACGGGSDPGPTATAAAEGTNPPATGTTQTSTSTPAAAATAPLAPVSLTQAFPALSFVRMTGMYAVPGSNRLVVTEQRGRIHIFEDNDGVASASVFMDISDRVSTGGNEEGLLGLAFAPDFERSGVFYLNFSAANPRRSIIARYTAAADRMSASPTSQDIIFEQAQPFSNHNGGQLAFGPDGYLYIGFGDGGAGNDPQNNAQNLGVLLGKILRIDVTGTSGNLNYRIPADNPFASQAGARGEIWAYGLRNPWRFSFDPANGNLWVGDVGQNALEEVDLVTKGGNYGWGQVEATRCVRPNCDPSQYIAPIVSYPTGSDCSVTGGFVYRAGRIPEIQGAYLYADYCSGKVWALRHDGAGVTEQMQVADANFRISSFAVDSDGDLYVLAHADNGGAIFRVGSAR